MGCPKAVPPSLLLCWWLSTAHSWFLLPHPRGCAGTRCGSEGLLPNADILGFALSGRTAGAENKAGFPARPGCFHCKQQIRSGLNQTEIIPGPGDLHRCKPQPNGTQNRELPSPLPPRAWHRSCPCGRQHWGEEKNPNGGGGNPKYSTSEARPVAVGPGTNRPHGTPRAGDGGRQRPGPPAALGAFFCSLKPKSVMRKGRLQPSCRRRSPARGCFPLCSLSTIFCFALTSGP